MKMKEFGPRGRPWRPLRSANGHIYVIYENLECYELIRRCSYFLYELASPLTCNVQPLSVHCKCVLMQMQIATNF